MHTDMHVYTTIYLISHRGLIHIHIYTCINDWKKEKKKEDRNIYRPAIAANRCEKEKRAEEREKRKGWVEERAKADEYIYNEDSVTTWGSPLVYSFPAFRRLLGFLLNIGSVR